MTKFTTFQECNSDLVLETSHDMSIDQEKIPLVVEKNMWHFLKFKFNYQ